MREVEERQELRIALVMNGGVSLAVWMGGVTRELDRVRRAVGPYKRLLDLTHCCARIDVIAGASAGGINGAVLAMAIARDETVDEIRKLWMDLGSIADLLRDPLEPDAPSILQGDGRLLDGLRKAMQKIAGDAQQKAKADDDPAPLHLVITTSPLVGQVKHYPDRFGATIADVSHRGLFQFRRLPKRPGAELVDDFAKQGAAGRLALAARSSASFPGAFEPSFVPVGATGSDDAHPDMTGIANFDGPRWAIDGGVLDNTPFRPALDAIRTLPAEAPVRRVLGYVVPEPLRPNPEEVRRDAMPPLREVAMDALSRLPRVQSIGRELEEIEDNNRRVRNRRDSRRRTLTEPAPGELEGMARILLGAYVDTRGQAVVYDIVGKLLEKAGADAIPGPDRIAAVRDELAKPEHTHWLPRRDQADLWEQGDSWRWGFAPIQNAGNVALDLLQRIVALRDMTPETQHAAMDQRWLLHEFLRRLRTLDAASSAYWRDAGQGSFPDAAAAGALADAWGEEFPHQLTQIASGIAQVIVDAAALPFGSDDPDDPAYEARRLADSLAGGDPPSADRTLRRLLALDVVQRSSGADLTGIEQPVELVLMSADSACSFGTAKPAAKKLAGLQFHHFGGFYKRSWRANDWMWGRLDGADRLVRTLLDPRRVQRRLKRGEPVAKLADEIERIVCDKGGPDTSSVIAKGWKQEVIAELEDLEKLAGEPSPTHLKATYEAIRARVQLEILVEELPEVVVAVRQDVDDGAAHDSIGATWARDLEEPLDTPKRLVDAFDACDVAGETLEKEAGSDYFTKVSTTAAAVVGSVMHGTVPESRWTRVPRAGLAALRGALLALFLLGRGVVDPENKTGRFLTALALATGGVLIAVYTLGVGVPGFLLLLGVLLVAAGVVLAWLRDRTTMQLALAAAALVLTIAGFYVVRIWHDRPRAIDGLIAVIAVIVAAVLAMWLGTAGKKKKKKKKKKQESAT